MKERPVVFMGKAVADAGGVVGYGRDARLLVDVAPIARGELPVLLASGPAVRDHPLARGAAVVERPDAVLLPGLVNAHAHLDLTGIGPRAYDPRDGFMTWVEMIRRERPVTDEAIHATVRRGVELSLKGGTVAVGDIAGAPMGRPSLAAWEAARESSLMGVSFVEFFAVGKGAERGVRAIEEVLLKVRGELREEEGMRVGVQPHAPNTVGLAGYRRAVALAAERGLPLSTHLAETWEEREFVGRASGPQRDFLERIGLWEDSMLGEFGHGRHPVAHLEEVLASAPFLAAHVNDADDAAIAALARTGTTVVYCPRASAYFGAAARFGAHRYREMMAAGAPVALGTDSVVNLDTPERISVLDEMRLLYRRDGVDASTLVRMGTVNGAAALGLPGEWFGFRGTGMRVAGVVGVAVGEGEWGNTPLDQAMGGEGAPELLLCRNYCCETRIEPI